MCNFLSEIDHKFCSHSGPSRRKWRSEDAYQHPENSNIEHEEVKEIQESKSNSTKNEDSGALPSREIIKPRKSLRAAINDSGDGDPNNLVQTDKEDESTLPDEPL